jgi:prephenate dehydrogenase
MQCPREMYGNTDITLFDKFTEVLTERTGYHTNLQEIKKIIEDNDPEKLERITELVNTKIN